MAHDTKYAKQLKRKWLGVLDRALRASTARLHKRYGDEKTAKLGMEFRKELEILLERMPRLDEHASKIWERQLALTTIFLAMYKVLKRYDHKPDQAWEVCMIVYGSYLGSLPGFVKRRMKKAGFNKRIRQTYMKDQEILSKRKVPEGDLMTFIDGKGRDFDFGMDIHECAKVKFLRREGALEFMPYVCLVDIMINEAMGVGLTRTKTIADGYDFCDFRLSENGEVRIESPVFKKEWHAYASIWRPVQ